MVDPAKSPRPNRRQFLSGQAARNALADLAERGAAQSPADTPARGMPSREPGSTSYLTQISRRAMATTFQVYLNAGQHPQGPDAALRALDHVQHVESQLSIYRADSQICRVNHAGSEHPVVVDEDVFRLLEQCRQLAEETGGAFDISSSPLSRLWGFHDRAGRYPDEAEIARVRQAIGTSLWTLDPAERTVRLMRPGMELNLGSIGKGYALDGCAALLETEGVENFLFHGGQSSLLARGSRMGIDPPGWWIALRHPFREQQRLGEIRLCDQALGTSGSGNQFFHHQGRRYGHILDPRTGRPAEGLLSTTVLAASASQADGLATALHVMGLEEAERFCRNRPDLAAVLVAPASRAGGIRVVVVGLDENQWRPDPGLAG